jgi:hypothetical protein
MATAFTDLGLSAELLAAIADAGYEAPTAIQTRTIPALLAGRDLIGQAKTGTGRRWCSPLPASWRSRWPRRSTRTGGAFTRSVCERR